MKKDTENKEGRMIIFTAPSGAGKSTIVRHLLKKYQDELAFSVSATTRKKRDHEIDGKDYYFISPEEFKDKINKNEFVEWEEVYDDQFYGTLKSEVERVWSEGKIIIFDVDVVGANDIKEEYQDQCLAIFIKPPSFEVHVQRLKDRNTESPGSLNKRIKRIQQEMGFQNAFDTILINDLLEVALMEAELLVKQFTGIQSEDLIADS